MERVVQFLKEAETYYLATVEATSQELDLLELHTFLKGSCIFRLER